MKRPLILLLTLLMAAGCRQGAPSEFSTPADISDTSLASQAGIRLEPPCWWVGMETPLQLMAYGPGLGRCQVRLEGLPGIKVKEAHKAQSPNYLFIDIAVAAAAKPGTGTLVFSGPDGEIRLPYTFAAKDRAARESFNTSDLIYLIFPDRFANADTTNDSSALMQEAADRSLPLGRHGGDIQGIIDHLDYISGLGATAIWSTPLLCDNQRRASYHGYAVSDYFRIDPRFGSNPLYAELAAKAHGKGLKLIMDIVTNHCGTACWFMDDLPFDDWIHKFDSYTGTNVCFSTNMDPNASQYDLNLQESGWFVPSMPDMNLDNPYTLQYLIQWAVWWTEYAKLDGLRVDTYPYNEKEPMSRWCQAVLKEYPWMNIVGECWTPEHDQLAYWQGGNPNRDGFDSHLPSIMDFPLQEAICAALGEGGDNPGWGRGMTRVYDCLSHDGGYHDLSNMMIFLANHDHGRLWDTFGGDVAKMKIALGLLATVRGIPQLYNGDEMFFSKQDSDDWGDGAKRVDFPGGWEGDAFDLFSAEGRSAAIAAGSVPNLNCAPRLHDYTARLFSWRKETPVLHHGRTMHFLSRDNTYAFFRYDDTDQVFVFVNNSDSAKNIPWSHYSEIARGSRGTDIISGETVTLSDETIVQAKTITIIKL